ncbi:hypothetical protein AB1399_04445 [Hydrogenibacillus schlegelii]
MNPEGKAAYWLDVDWMINEGLGGGIVSPENGLIDEHPAPVLRPFNPRPNPPLEENVDGRFVQRLDVRRLVPLARTQ